MDHLVVCQLEVSNKVIVKRMNKTKYDVIPGSCTTLSGYKIRKKIKLENLNNHIRRYTVENNFLFWFSQSSSVHHGYNKIQCPKE